MVFAAAPTRSFGITKYIVWRHEVGTRKDASHKSRPREREGFCGGRERAKVGQCARQHLWRLVHEIPMMTRCSLSSMR